uniref:Putative secreted protein n=1 Tax=Anopheles darlingi TaxID=43151 RepID=A0A2M4DC21_ANODA
MSRISVLPGCFISLFFLLFVGSHQESSISHKTLLGREFFDHQFLLSPFVPCSLELRDTVRALHDTTITTVVVKSRKNLKHVSILCLAPAATSRLPVGRWFP